MKNVLHQIQSNIISCLQEWSYIIFLTFYFTFKHFILFQISEWGMLYSIAMDHKVSQLTEKDIQSKLDLLFKKNFYDVAIR